MSQTANQHRGRRALLAKYPWLTFLLPLVIFVLVGCLEPKPPDGGGTTPWWAVPYRCYPLVYTLKLALTIAAVLYVLPGYRQFPFRPRPLAVLAGLVGGLVWVGLCSLQLEERLLAPLGLGKLVDLGTRSAFNPFQDLRSLPVAWAWGFLAIRLFGLVALVPVIEEFFLRGFLMRFCVEADWSNVPFGKVNTVAVLAGTLVPMLMHPAELFAAAVWFSMITWLMVKTRNIWDCILAHAITNALLGGYVLFNGNWHLM